MLIKAPKIKLNRFGAMPMSEPKISKTLRSTIRISWI